MSIILNRKNISCFPVPLVHSSVFVNLKHEKSQNLTFHPWKIDDYENGPFDDMISFAISAERNGITPYICNEDPIYGYVMLPLEGESATLKDDLPNLLNLGINRC